MDNSITSHSDPILIHANWFQFAAGERIIHLCVKSRMIVWCKSGAGTVIANRESFQFRAGSFLILPWKHRVEYQADHRQPFMVAGLHLIPHHQITCPVDYDVAHSKQSPLYKNPDRLNVEIDRLEKPFFGVKKSYPAFNHITEYALEKFVQAPEKDEDFLRMLGKLLLNEISQLPQIVSDTNEQFPRELRSMSVFIREHLQTTITMDDLMEVSNLSPATINRLFQNHCKTSPLAWVTGQRLEKAKELLITTRLSISKVAEESGFQDPYYFSRCFKKHTAQTPKQFRNESAKL